MIINIDIHTRDRNSSGTRCTHSNLQHFMVFCHVMESLIENGGASADGMPPLYYAVFGYEKLAARLLLDLGPTSISM